VLTFLALLSAPFLLADGYGVWVWA